MAKKPAPLSPDYWEDAKAELMKIRAEAEAWAIQPPVAGRLGKDDPDWCPAAGPGCWFWNRSAAQAVAGQRRKRARLEHAQLVRANTPGEQFRFRGGGQG